MSRDQVFSSEKDFRRFLSGHTTDSRSVGKLASAIWGGAGITTSQVIPVSSAEILSLSTTEKLLIPAPGPDKFIVPIDMIYRYNYGTVAYNAGEDTSDLKFILPDAAGEWIGGEGVQLTFNGNFQVEDLTASFQSYLLSTAGFTITPNVPLILGNVGSGALVDGDGTLSIQIRYRVVNL